MAKYHVSLEFYVHPFESYCSQEFFEAADEEAALEEARYRAQRFGQQPLDENAPNAWEYESLPPHDPPLREVPPQGTSYNISLMGSYAINHIEEVSQLPRGRH